MKEKIKVNTSKRLKSEAKKLGWAGLRQIEPPAAAAASGSRVAAWVSHSQVSPTVATVCHGLTAAARSRWESKLHGVGVGGGGGVVGVGECTVGLSLSRLSTLCLTSLFSSFFSFFYLGFFALSITLFGADC